MAHSKDANTTQLNNLRFTPTATAAATATHDFRSDTLTTPTKAMLDAIVSTTYHDDGYAEDSTTNELEAHIASLTGKEAGLLVMSGVMGNQVCIRTNLTQPPYSIVCDSRAHIITSEAGAISTLWGAMPIAVKPGNGRYLTLEDVRAACVLGGKDTLCPTRLICLENTIFGTVMPLEEVNRISQFARENGIKMHLDGARLWEAVVAGAGSLGDFCELFDSVTMCFSKGLGAPLGSIVVGSREFVSHAKRIRKMVGGGGRQSGIISAAARVAVDQGFGRDGTVGHLKACHMQAARLAERWQAGGGKLVWPTETNMIWLDLGSIGLTVDEWVEMAKEQGIVLNGGRLVIHYQLASDAIERLEKLFDTVLKSRRPKSKL